MPCAWSPNGAEQVAMLVQDASILQDEKLVCLGLVGGIATPGPRLKPRCRRAFGRRLTDVSRGRASPQFGEREVIFQDIFPEGVFDEPGYVQTPRRQGLFRLLR